MAGSSPDHAMSESSSAVKIRLLFFAKARELVGVSEVEIDDLLHACGACDACSGRVETSGARILQAVLTRFPDLSSIKDSIILAHNLEYIDVERETPVSIKSGDEIAVIPPVSGG